MHAAAVFFGDLFHDLCPIPVRGGVFLTRLQSERLPGGYAAERIGNADKQGAVLLAHLYADGAGLRRESGATARLDGVVDQVGEHAAQVAVGDGQARRHGDLVLDAAAVIARLVPLHIQDGVDHVIAAVYDRQRLQHPIFTLAEKLFQLFVLLFAQHHLHIAVLIFHFVAEHLQIFVILLRNVQLLQLFFLVQQHHLRFQMAGMLFSARIKHEIGQQLQYPQRKVGDAVLQRCPLFGIVGQHCHDDHENDEDDDARIVYIFITFRRTDAQVGHYSDKKDEDKQAADPFIKAAGGIDRVKPFRTRPQGIQQVDRMHRIDKEHIKATRLRDTRSDAQAANADDRQGRDQRIGDDDHIAAAEDHIKDAVCQQQYAPQAGRLADRQRHAPRRTPIDGGEQKGKPRRIQHIFYDPAHAEILRQIIGLKKFCHPRAPDPAEHAPAAWFIATIIPQPGQKSSPAAIFARRLPLKTVQKLPHTPARGTRRWRERCRLPPYTKTRRRTFPPHSGCSSTRSRGMPYRACLWRAARRSRFPPSFYDKSMRNFFPLIPKDDNFLRSFTR